MDKKLFDKSIKQIEDNFRCKFADSIVLLIWEEYKDETDEDWNDIVNRIIKYTNFPPVFATFVKASEDLEEEYSDTRSHEERVRESRKEEDKSP